MYSNYTITLVIPCLNEEQGLTQLLKTIPDFIDEVIVVDNNSTDKTAEIARMAGAKVLFESKRGYGKSYKSGVEAATSDFVVTLDGDGSYLAADIEKLVKISLEEQKDFAP